MIAIEGSSPGSRRQPIATLSHCHWPLAWAIALKFSPFRLQGFHIFCSFGIRHWLHFVTHLMRRRRCVFFHIWVESQLGDELWHKPRVLQMLHFRTPYLGLTSTDKAKHTCYTSHVTCSFPGSATSDLFLQEPFLSDLGTFDLSRCGGVVVEGVASPVFQPETDWWNSSLAPVARS